MKIISLKLIKFYQNTLSGHKGCFGFLNFSCKFYPICSVYCYEAIDKFGFFKGINLSIKRLLRCNPCSVGGVDELPYND
ncbi:MAG: membrane protein insertion efficiency factor YidD [Parcubacteria group bacterium GW2011_GWA2_38_13b]|nr:MAG: membrane protein insertion efficiency factor YidD [Parcubacteria group bacterium GW2011_GWA2_38_13b]